MLVLVTVIIVVTQIISVFPQWKDSSHKWALIVTASLGVAAALLSFKTSMDTNESEKATTDTLNSNLKQTRVINDRQIHDSLATVRMQSTIDSQRFALASQYDLIDQLRRENTELNLQLSNKAHEIFGQLTGENSYCQMSLFYGRLNPGETRNLQYISFNLLGRFPLHNVNIRIVDLNSPDPSNRNEFILKLDRLQKEVCENTRILVEMDTVKGININVFYDANNGIGAQQFRMRYRNQRWYKAERFSHGLTANGKFLDIIEKGYPYTDPLDIFILNKL